METVGEGSMPEMAYQTQWVFAEAVAMSTEPRKGGAVGYRTPAAPVAFKGLPGQASDPSLPVFLYRYAILAKKPPGPHGRGMRNKAPALAAVRQHGQ